MCLPTNKASGLSFANEDGEGLGQLACWLTRILHVRHRSDSLINAHIPIFGPRLQHNPTSPSDWTAVNREQVGSRVRSLGVVWARVIWT